MTNPDAFIIFGHTLSNVDVVNIFGGLVFLFAAGWAAKEGIEYWMMCRRDKRHHAHK